VQKALSGRQCTSSNCPPSCLQRSECCHEDSALLVKLSTFVSGTYRKCCQEDSALLAKLSTFVSVTDRQYWLQTQLSGGQPTHLCGADKLGMFPNIPSCRLPLHQLHHFAVPHTHTHTHMDIACNFITNIFHCDTNLNPTWWHSSTILHLYLGETCFESWPHHHLSSLQFSWDHTFIRPWPFPCTVFQSHHS
jgi:hypothetical protein